MFLSHTSELSDFPVGRSFVAAAKDAVSRAGDAVVEMRYFGPSSDAPSATSASRVVWSDVYVGIIGMRYGSPTRERPELSHTELEFETATAYGLRRLIFLLDQRSDQVPGPIGPSELDERQTAFRARLMDAGLTVALVATPAELEVLLVQALHELPDLTAIANKQAPDLLARVRRDLLRQVHDLVVEQAESLDRLACIEVGLLEQRSVVARPRNRVLHRENEPDRPLPRDRRISDVFRDLGAQLLILGEPGAGKTTLLHELADELLQEALGDPSAPVPVVLHLSSWAADRFRLDRWLVEELHRTYGVSKGLSVRWLAAGHIVPLLDGLDEVVQHRDACAAAINAFRERYGQLPFAVCCRVNEYRALKNQLVLHDAVLILPLDRNEVESYIERAGEALSGVREALRRDEALWELLTTPLFLNLVAVTYRGQSLEVVREEPTLQKLRSNVLDDYIRRMLERVPVRPTAGYGRREMVAWLRWMATAMTSGAQSVFHLDLIQPGWLPTVSRRRLVTIGVPAALGLLAALFTVLVLMLAGGQRLSGTYQARYVLVDAIAFGLALAIIVYQPDIKPTLQLGWSWRTLSRSLPGVLGSTGIALIALASAFGLAAAVLTTLDPRAELGWAPHAPLDEGLLVLAQVAAMCAGAGAAVALTAGIDERYAIDAPFPGHAILATRRNWLVGTFILGLPAALVFPLASQRWGQAAQIALLRYFSPWLPGDAPLIVVALITGAAVGFALGLLIRLTLPIGPRQRLLHGLLVGVVAAATVGPAQFIFVHLVGSLGTPVAFWLVPGVPVWPFAGTLAGLIVVFGGSVRTSTIAGVIAAVTAGVTLQNHPSTAVFATLPFVDWLTPDWLLFAVGVIIAVGMRLGGGAFLRHWTLRWLLTRSRLAPWHWAPFLEHATRLNLLRRRGGGYEFVHRLVQERFLSWEA